MKIAVLEPSLVVLIGVAGSGKSTFASRHFRPTEVLSSDACRAMVSDAENDMGATTAAFEVLHFIAAKRLTAGKVTVVDATNVQRESRRALIELARSHQVVPVAIVFDLPEKLCRQRNAARPDREVRPHVIRRQRSQLERSLGGLELEGFRRVFILRTPGEVDAVVIEREPARNDTPG